MLVTFCQECVRRWFLRKRRVFEEIGGDKNFGEVFQVPETGSKAIARSDVHT